MTQNYSPRLFSVLLFAMAHQGKASQFSIHKKMNRILSLIAAMMLTLSTYAANMELDRSWYLAGEAMKVSVTTDNAIIAYAELRDMHSMVAGAVIGLENGKGTGTVQLPSDLHSGYYLLSVYTRDNANVSHRLVAVVNSLSKNEDDDIEWVQITTPDSLSYSATIEGEKYADSEPGKKKDFLDEFTIDGETAAMIRKYANMCDTLQTDIYESLVRGNGQFLSATDSTALKDYSSTIEKVRADLLGLYYIADPKLAELNLMADTVAYKSRYYTYLMNGLLTHGTQIKLGNNIEDAHMQTCALIANWTLAHADGAMELVKRKTGYATKTYLKINDYPRLRELFATLLAEIQRIKTEGNILAARNMVETYGTKLDRNIHKEVIDRYDYLTVAPITDMTDEKAIDIRETEGHIIKARVKNVYDGVTYNANQIRPSIGIVGKQVHYFAGKMRNDTTAVFYTYGLHGKQPLVLSAASYTGVSLPIEMISPFISLPPKRLPHLVFHYNRTEVETRSLDMQRHQIAIASTKNEPQLGVYEDAAAEDGVPLDYDSTIFGEKPDLTYNLDEYRQFLTIKEVLIEYVSRVQRTNINGVPQLTVRDEDGSYDNTWPAMVFIDGMPVIDVDRLLNYDARRIHYVNIYRNKYTFGREVYRGIVSFVSRSGRLTNYPTEPNVQYLVYEFPQ